MIDPQKIIVYRSRIEQQNDEFWVDHPEVALGIAGALVLVIVGFWLMSIWESRRR